MILLLYMYMYNYINIHMYVHVLWKLLYYNIHVHLSKNIFKYLTCTYMYMYTHRIHMTLFYHVKDHNMPPFHQCRIVLTMQKHLQVRVILLCLYGSKEQCHELVLERIVGNGRGRGGKPLFWRRMYSSCLHWWLDDWGNVWGHKKWWNWPKLMYKYMYIVHYTCTMYMYNVQCTCTLYMYIVHVQCAYFEHVHTHVIIG